MKILITGGAGFIGSHLAEHCSAEGWGVTVLDDLSNGQVENLALLSGGVQFTFRLGTIFNRELVDELVRSCDVVFHLAAAVGVRLIMNSPTSSILTNFEGLQSYWGPLKDIESASSSPQALKSMVRVPAYPSVRMATWCSEPRIKSAGVTLAAKQWTST
jgi:dTDP-D-glucose 4,6-dehydratase